MPNTRPITLLLLFFFSCRLVSAQQIFPTPQTQTKDGAPVYVVQLNEALIVAPQTFKNDTDRYRYNQLKHYVKIVLPYANEAIRLFYQYEKDTEEMNRRNRKKYFRSKEPQLKSEFEDKLKELNITQAQILVKLINRQLNKNCYSIIREIKSPIGAAYYQTWARLNGINMNENYNPDNEPQLERILRGLGY